MKLQRPRPGSEAVSGHPKGISGSLRAVGSLLTHDLRSPRGTGRAERGGAAQGRGNRQGATGPPSSSPSVRLTTERRRSLPATALAGVGPGGARTGVAEASAGIPRAGTRGWRGGGSAPPFEPPFEAELGARFAGGRRMSMPCADEGIAPGCGEPRAADSRPRD